jgi:hypothetical protein
VKLIAAFGVASMLLCVTLAHADPPARSFVGDFIGNDATPDNTFSIGGSLDRLQNSESLYLEKAISPESSFSLFGGYQRLEQEGEDTSGWSNLSLAYKHTLFASSGHEFLASLSPEVELPVGNRSVGSESHTRAGGDLLAQKGFGDLPDSLWMLRPAALESDLGWESKVTGARDDLLSADVELEYSLFYLDENVGRFVPRAIRDFTPHLDFDYAQYLSAHRNSSAPDFELTPAIAWMNSLIEINLGVDVGVNHAATADGAVSFVWNISLEYDQLVPALGWTPLR